MKNSFVTSSNGRNPVTAITDNPFPYGNGTYGPVTKKPPDLLQPRYSRAKKIFSSLRNFTSASSTPSASPNRAFGNGYVCKIPRVCCRYASPKGVPTTPEHNSTYGHTAGGYLSKPFYVNDGSHFRRRTESDSSHSGVVQGILDTRALKCYQAGRASDTSSITNASEILDLTRAMSSVPKSLSDGKRGVPNGSLPGSRIPTGATPTASSSFNPYSPTASSLQRQVRSTHPQNAQIPTQKIPPAPQGSSRLAVTSPPATKESTHYASVRKADLAKMLSQSGVSQGAPGNQTYTLIAYQPNNSGSTDPHKPASAQQAVLYAIPSNHAFLQQHQIQQLVLRHSGQAAKTSAPSPNSLPTTVGLAQHHGPNSSASTAPPSSQQKSTQQTNLPHHLLPPCQGLQNPVVVGGGQRGGELVCTCPPELHQALAEQQMHHSHHQLQSRLQQAPNTVLLNGGGQIADPTHTTAPINGRGLSTLESNQPLHCVEPHCSRRAPDHHNDADSHIDYLVTLFQALRASGVQEDSFASAFRLMGIKQQPTAKQLAKVSNSQNTLRHLRISVVNLKQEHVKMKVEFVKEVQNCERLVAVQLKKYERRKGLLQSQPFYDTRINKVRSDRQALDNALAAYQTTWSSLIGQLADLEGVIEETGNDVLKGRCRITLHMIGALEDRLQLATSAIEFCCENDPLLRKSIWQHAENEMDSAEQETRILEDQLEQLSDLRERSSRLNGTIGTLTRLAKVNAKQVEEQVNRWRSIGGVLNATAADRGSVERKRLMSTIRMLQPDHNERMRSIEIQEALRERRKRVFRDPPLFKVPAKALLLNGVHVSPIWPETFSRRSKISTASPVPELSDDMPEPLETPNTTANLPQPLRIPQTLTPATTISLVSRLRNPNTPRVKRNSRVKFNMEVHVEGQDLLVPLNCILDEDSGSNNGEMKRRLVPAQPSLVDEIPPAPPPRLSSVIETQKMANQSIPVKLLRYENMDSFLQSINQHQKTIPTPENA